MRVRIVLVCSVLAGERKSDSGADLDGFVSLVNSFFAGEGGLWNFGKERDKYWFTLVSV